ncbi:MAG: hypothetical protein LBE27_01120 [Deltaproteobacteria bacterium]|jgi:hypothetical protein|nr:hypothetical protein [Deltaproteobacteria bacterium]
MILHCPGCRAKLRLADEYKNNKEIWIKCPKCGERFRPQSSDLVAQLTREPKVEGPSPESRRKVEDLLNRMDLDKMSQAKQDRDEFSLDAIPVIPEPPQRAKIFLVITALLVVAMLLALGIIFKYSVAPPVQTQAAETPPPPDYGKDILLYDLMSLRKDILKLRHVDRTINYRGRESRIYKYFVSNLAPDLCQDITNIHIWSPQTSQGFKMSASCLSPTLEAATLEVDWNINAAKISIPGRPLVVDLPLPRP